MMGTRTSKPKTISNESVRLPEFLEELVSDQNATDFRGMDTGFKHLNRVINGLNEGLYIIGGMPGCGKTTLAWQIACQVAQKNNVPVAFMSLDQSVDALRTRLLSRLTGIENKKLFFGRLEPQSSEIETLRATVEDYKKTAKYIHLIGPEFDIYCGFDDCSDDYCGDSQTGEFLSGPSDPLSAPRYLRMLCNTLFERYGDTKCLVVVDYLQKIYPARKYSSEYERLNIVTDELRMLSESTHSPILAISEVNRESYKSPKIDAFKNSGRIEYAADVACVLQEVGKNNNQYREMELKVLKNRNGERATIQLDFYPETSRFEEVDKTDIWDDE